MEGASDDPTTTGIYRYRKDRGAAIVPRRGESLAKYCVIRIAHMAERQFMRHGSEGMVVGLVTQLQFDRFDVTLIDVWEEKAHLSASQ
jgi:hypothetical protein